MIADLAVTSPVTNQLSLWATRMVGSLQGITRVFETIIPGPSHVTTQENELEA
jgi:hypothetical protein